jgi:outer membrane protein assembly factor BamD
MFKRFISILGIAVVLFSFAACTNKKVSNPIAQVDSKQPDKILFDRAMDAMKHNKFDVARLTLQTLINTYPDSEFVARAKLAVGDSWYAEGGSAALIQAENEYKDFITFFPNMPEAAEAQLKIANIHYREMEKPDRDYTHAKRAEDEYRQLLIQFPDSKLVAEAKQRLLEVQEVLAEREFRIGRFYYMRESWNAAIARLKSLADAYPLYSGADEALFMLGNAYEHQADAIRALPGDKVNEVLKGQMLKRFEDQAAAAYSQLVTRYPVMERAGDAKARLEAMRRQVPTPTADAIAQNKKEQESRSETSMWGRMMGNIHKGPDVASAAKVGDPTLVDPKPTNAPELIRQTNDAMVEAVNKMSNNGKVSVETVKDGAPPPNDPTPRSDNGTPADNGVPELQPIPDASTNAPAQPTTPPTQLNEVQQPQAQADPATTSSSSSSSSVTATPATTNGTAPAATTDQKQEDKPEFSTSKKKQKKGLRKIVPF